MTRVSPSGFRTRDATIGFGFDGKVVMAASGETVAAALAVAGELALRQTRDGDRRGPFCGMGVCHECLVSIDGLTARACMTEARPGMIISRHAPRQEKALPPSAAEQPPLSVDIAVIGAGPAGVAAARAAAASGLSVLLVDERSQPGGQYHKQPAKGFSLDPDRLDHQFREGAELAAAAIASGVRLLTSTSVWAPHGEDGLLLRTPDGARRLDARRIVLATGAAERCPPFPGWTLPGVMTTGAAQTFLRAYGVCPGHRVLIAGAGPLNLQLAAELSAAGVHVVGVAEASGGLSLPRFAAALRMLAASPELVGKGLRYRLALARAGIPFWGRTVIAAATGEDRVNSVTLAPLGRDGRPNLKAARKVACDLLCLGYGFNPAVELAAAMGCELRLDPRWRHLAVVADADGRTTRPHVFAIGDGARFGGAAVAMAMGQRAGQRAASDLAPGRLAQMSDDSDKSLRTVLAFQQALWAYHDAPALTHELATPETLICRCEPVSRADLERACEAGASTLGAVKRATRLGMGRCQGRYCAPVAAALIADRTGRETGPEDFFAPRTPLKPIRIGEIAALDLGDKQ